MIRVYLDWNVINKMKRGQYEKIENDFELSFEEILCNKERFLVPFTNFHIGDIFHGYKKSGWDENIESDLEYLKKLTNNFCIINYSDGSLKYDENNPHDLLKERIDSEDIIQGLQTNGLNYLKELVLDESEPNEELESLFDTIEKLDLDLDNPFKDMGVDLKNFDSIMKGMGDYYTNIFNGESYLKLRNVHQDGLEIEKDKLFSNSNKNPISLINDVYNEKLGKSFDEVGKESLQSIKKETHDFIDEITTTYLQLDISGYRQDKISVKGNKKQTFSNLTNDASHCAYASMCDIYVIDDRKGYEKTIKTFEHHDIHTKVLKPDEFLEYYKNYLNHEGGITSVLYIFDLLKHPPTFSEIRSGMNVYTYFIHTYLFSYFNRVEFFYEKDGKIDFICLGKFKPKNSNVILYKELEGVINNLFSCFKEYSNSKKEANNDDYEKFLNEEKWTFRSWNIGDADVELKVINGYMQLYFYYDDKS